MDKKRIIIHELIFGKSLCGLKLEIFIYYLYITHDIIEYFLDIRKFKDKMHYT